MLRFYLNIEIILVYIIMIKKYDPDQTLPLDFFQRLIVLQDSFTANCTSAAKHASMFEIMQGKPQSTCLNTFYSKSENITALK
jgi:hypothetical protein